MVQYDELMMFIIGIATLVIMFSHRTHLRRIQHWRLLVLSFGFVLFGWAATVLEGLFLGELANYLEHAAYAFGALAISIWCWIREGTKQA